MAQATDLILVDGSSFLYRAYYAAKKGLSTKAGFPTGATYIITRMLRNLVNDYANHKILVTFDAKGGSFRNTIYPDYKANRPPMPEDLAVQVPVIHHIVVAMGFPVISLPGVEADDVLGSYATAAAAQGLNVLICTGDKDLAQLVTDKILLKDTMKDITYNRDEVIKKHGVPPELIIDFLALKGDASDNIPGMSGVGDVTAKLLLNGIGGVYTIKNNLEKIKEVNFRGNKTFADRFMDQWEQIEISYKLATIKCDVPLPFPISEINVPQENNDVLIALFERLEFFRFAAEQRAKKTAFNDLLTDVHGKDSQGTQLTKPHIVGFQLGQLVFQIPKGQEVEDIEDPNKAGTAAHATGTQDSPTAEALAEAVDSAKQQAASASTNANASNSTQAISDVAHKNSSAAAIEAWLSPVNAANANTTQSVVAQSQGATAAATTPSTTPASTTESTATNTAQVENTDKVEVVATNSDADLGANSGKEAGAEANGENKLTLDDVFIIGLNTGRPRLDQQVVSKTEAVSLLSQIEGATDPALLEELGVPQKKTRGRKSTKKDTVEVASAASDSSSATAAIAKAAKSAKTAQETKASSAVSDTSSPSSSTATADNASGGVDDMDSLLAVLKESQPHDNIDKFINSFKLVLTEQELKDLIAKLEKSERFAFSLNSDASQPSMANLIGISLSLAENDSYYIPLGHSFIGVPAQLPLQDTLEALSPIFNHEKILKVAHDIKQHRLLLSFAGIEMSGPMLDTMVLCHLLDSSQTIYLHQLAERYNHYTSLLYDQSFDYFSPSALSDFNTSLKKECEKSLMTFRLAEAALQELSERYPKNKGTELMSFEMEVLEVLYHMERRGALVDSHILAKLTKAFKHKLSSLEEQIFNEVGEKFRLTSPRILGRMLFEKMGIPYPRASNKVDVYGHKSYSTSEEILSELTAYPIAKLILEYRSLSKIISTYADKLPSLISLRTGRVHTNFNLAGTNTGRLSSSEPNLQNIPAHDSDGKMIREAFVAPDGYSIVSADYSQIELRIIAHLSEDPNLKQAFLNHQDVHLVAAAEVLGKPISEVTPEERSHAKSTNYGLMYGMSFQGLAKQTGIGKAQAKEFITNYFRRYPAVKDYMEKVKRYATRYGYITSLTGRKIYIKDIKSTGMVYRQASRAAINAPMQSGAADIIKHAMVDIHKYIKSLEPGSVYMTLQVHDELVFEVKNSVLDEFCAKLQEIMVKAYKIDVPLEVSVGCAQSWGQAH